MRKCIRSECRCKNNTTPSANRVTHGGDWYRAALKGKQEHRALSKRWKATERVRPIFLYFLGWTLTSSDITQAYRICWMLTALWCNRCRQQPRMATEQTGIELATGLIVARVELPLETNCEGKAMLSVSNIVLSVSGQLLYCCALFEFVVRIV